MEESYEGHEIWVFLTLVVGFALSFLVAVVPHFESAHRLDPLLLATWMIPYLILSIIVWFMPVPARPPMILALAGLQLLSALIQRTLLDDPTGLLVYLVPLLTAPALLLLAPRLIGRGGGSMATLIERLFKRG
ncbi:MAG: hypothetical protein EOM91_13005 [Sphingobacteriia bacterium]|nr:hypothetical protein [Sphingobacteriia bacterium]NCC39735.1 hypothetical protein [Gammaproteobacteria bacterium]